MLPAWRRRTPKVTEGRLLLYLNGVSTSEFVPALGQFLGSSAGPVVPNLCQRELYYRRIAC
jgi:hypothetical protein